MEQPGAKSTLRSALKLARDSIAPDQKLAFDQIIRQRIECLDSYRLAQCVWSFFSDGAEPDLSGLTLAKKKRFFYPRFCPGNSAYEMVEVSDPEHEIVPGKFGILEPIEKLPALTREEAAKFRWCRLVPAVGCDLNGTRLGRGKGFYDRLLPDFPGAAYGILYECQIADCIPQAAHDYPLDGVITERRKIVF